MHGVERKWNEEDHTLQSHADCQSLQVSVMADALEEMALRDPGRFTPIAHQKRTEALGRLLDMENKDQDAGEGDSGPAGEGGEWP